MKRHGLTLIELLIALSITMIMMGAFVTLMGNMTNNVADSRAVIEISERLRSARNRLQKDLESVTARMVPPLDPASNSGYFEYTEGTNSFDAYGSITVNGSTLNYGVNNLLVPSSPSNPILLGDIDDVLMFTIHGRGEMFSGNIGGTTYQAADAEVAWFLRPQYDPLIPPVAGVPQQRTIMTANGPMPLYSLYRRVLLVEPALMSNANVVTLVSNPSSTSGGAGLLPLMLQTTNTNASFPSGTLDLSLYADQEAIAYYFAQGQSPLASGTVLNVIKANTLASLGRHENRFGHTWDGFTASGTSLYTSVFASPSFPTATRPNSNLLNMTFLGPATVNLPDAMSTNISPRYGEDVILTDVLAFDVQAFDPNAPTMVAANGDAIEPKDPAYQTLLSGSVTPASMGAFVDLGWWSRLPSYTPSTSLQPWLGGNAILSVSPYPPIYNAGGTQISPSISTTNPPVTITAYPTYDTWTTAYEAFGPATNGLDDDNDGIVDNESERRTTPPFSKPLRALRVTLRVYEPASQQVRQVTVVQDFLPQ